MVGDVHTIFNGNTSAWDKILAGGDLLLNGAMDISMFLGVGEVARGLYALGRFGGEMVVKDLEEQVEKEGEQTLYHYTNEKGMNGILDSETLHPSESALNPKDARYGDGQYLTDIAPGSMTKGQISRRLWGVPWNSSKISHFVAIDVTGLPVMNPAKNIFLIPGNSSLDLAGRIIDFGSTP